MLGNKIRGAWNDYVAYIHAPNNVQGPMRPLVKPYRVVAKTNLTLWIFIGMLIGILIGAVNPQAGITIGPFGTAFIRMIQTLMVPLIFSTLVVGIAGHGDDLVRIGRLALKSIIYFLIVTTLALAVGLVMVNICRPGDGIDLTNVSVSKQVEDFKNKSITWEDEFNKIIPKSFFQAASDNEVLSIVFCAVMFSVGIIKVDQHSKRTMLAFCDSLSNIMFKVVALVMNYAPIGIAAALAATVGKNGVGVLINLGKLVGTLYGALAIFVLVIFVPIILVLRIPFVGFLKHVGLPWLIAFSTASSESALPRAMENMQKFGVPKRIVAFVIPCGYSFNLDGTTLYLSLAAIFCAQAGGMNLDIGRQLAILGTLILSSKGVAAIPRASMVVLAGTVTSYGLPQSAVTLILGVDALMDMARTSVNVFGNCLACVVMSKWEGVFRGEEWQEEMRQLEFQAQRELQDDLEANNEKVNPDNKDGVSVSYREHAEYPRPVDIEERQDRHP
ncbi:uncharacterized protein VTP21DRAFT_7676 [Calcarisporiella thermophila]|uniref:uncharacterized protein n=1 Tax=Calcarisporiella thermophila TaxID=911321 RepID=UPI003743F0A5